MTEAQVTAAALAETWQAREVEMRATVPDEEFPAKIRMTKIVTSPRSAAIERCRMDLCEAFNINPTIR